MKIITKRLLSFLTAAATVLSLTSTMSCVSAAQKDPKDIDRVVVDCRSEEAFGKTSSVYKHTPTASEPDPFTGGKYEFNDSMKAMEVLYNSNQKGNRTFRVLPFFNRKGNLTAEYKYFVVVYAAKTNSPFKISVWNGMNAGPEMFPVTEGKDTNAKFVVSAPVDISGANANGVSSLSRWMSTIHSTISFLTSDKDARFFIREFAFFKSPEDAKAYYDSVDLDKSPTEYGENAVKPESAASQSAAAPSNAKTVNLSYTTVEEPAVVTAPTDEKVFEPVIMSFEGEEAFKSNGKFNTFPEFEEGKYSFVTLPDGTNCLKLEYYPFKAFSAYRMMATFNKSGTVSSHHKYMRITFMTNDATPASITLYNNKTAHTTVLVPDTSYSRGEFVRSNAVEIATGGHIERYVNMIHNTVGYTGVLDGAEFYIKEIGFFTTEKQAYDYYGDSYNADAGSIPYSELRFGKDGNASANRNEANWGTSVDGEDSLEITYCQSTNVSGVKYMSKIKSLSNGTVGANDRFMRVLYSAKNPEGVEKASMLLHCDINSERVLVSDSIVDTDGSYVLSPAVYLTEKMIERFSGTIHNSLIINAVPDGGRYDIKAIYFFATRKDAEMFTLPSDDHSITVVGNDISKYSIVVSEDAPINVKEGAKEVARVIKKQSKVEIPVVTDKTAESPYEILIGPSNRTVTTDCLDEIRTLNENAYRIFVKDAKVILTAPLGYGVVEGVSVLANNIFYGNSRNVPEVIEIEADLSVSGALTRPYTRPTHFEAGEAVPTPTVFTEDFDTDEGYFGEDQGETNWSYADGAYKTEAAVYASSYVHVYEKNLTYKAQLSYTKENGGTMGILARVNSEASYVKAGYDFGAGAWYVESRGSQDFYISRDAEATATLSPNTVYTVELILDGDYATLTVDGAAVITNAKVTHFSPGRLGVYAENCAVAVDDIELTLTSGQGTVLKNVRHTKLYTDTYMEGGTVTEMKDGSLIYTHQSLNTYKSADNGVTWVKTDKWLDNTHGYLNLIRLANGDLLHVVGRTVNGVSYRAARISSDEGKTWVDGGIICESKYNNSTANAGNMNDKLTVTASGRILFSQNYESATVQVEGRNVFCRYYFSDNNGMTWYKSETDSWTIEGVDTHHFGENKLLECADGTVRMYASWHPLGRIVYADSTDGGKTFGPLQYMQNMYCVQSSMQFVRDPYADNDTTYYMVWVNAEQVGKNKHYPRSRLSLAMSADGKNWVYLGDIWRWENDYAIGTEGQINHVVDPFIKVTEDYIICGSGFADGVKIPNEGGAAAHHGQRQHIYSIRKDTLPEGIILNNYSDVPYGSELYSAVTYVTDKGILPSVSETDFAPFVTISGKDLAAAVAILGADVDTASLVSKETVTVSEVLDLLTATCNVTPSEIVAAFGGRMGDVATRGDVAVLVYGFMNGVTG